MSHILLRPEDLHGDDFEVVDKKVRTKKSASSGEKIARTQNFSGRMLQMEITNNGTTHKIMVDQFFLGMGRPMSVGEITYRDLTGRDGSFPQYKNTANEYYGIIEVNLNLGILRDNGFSSYRLSIPPTNETMELLHIVDGQNKVKGNLTDVEMAFKSGFNGGINISVHKDLLDKANGIIKCAMLVRTKISGSKYTPDGLAEDSWVNTIWGMLQVWGRDGFTPADVAGSSEASMFDDSEFRIARELDLYRSSILLEFMRENRIGIRVSQAY